MCAQIARTYSSTSDVVTGATILAAHLNTDLDKIYSEFNGSIDNDNIKSAAAIAVSKTALGTYTAPGTWTPTLSVSGGTAPTYTADDLSYYCQIGKMVFGSILWINSAGGTAGAGANDLAFTLPVEAANVGATSLKIIGGGFMMNGTDIWPIHVGLSNSTHGIFVETAALDTRSGADQNNAIRQVRAWFMYHVA